MSETLLYEAEVTGKPKLQILLCAPRGFCAGVVRAIDAVEQALRIYGAPVYVRHEIVHNKYVVEGLKAKGAIFVEELDEIPDTQQPVIFSAHGVPRSVPATVITCTHCSVCVHGWRAQRVPYASFANCPYS